MVYDPKVTAANIRQEVLGDRDNSNLEVAATASAACADTHAIAVLTEWDEFKTLDFVSILQLMHKPAFVFDGRNILPHRQLAEMGYRVHSVGKSAQPLRE